MRFTGKVVPLALAIAMLGGCSNIQKIGEAAGVVPSQEQQEFEAVNARLTLPPDYGLRPPQPGSGRASAQAATSRGRSTLLGPSRGTAAGSTNFERRDRSSGENALLSRAAGSSRVDQNIRRVVDTETRANEEAEDEFTNRLLRWEDRPEGDVPGEDTPRITRSGDL